MTITEVLKIIKKERIELEIYEELHKWLMEDRCYWTDRAMDAESSMRIISKIIRENDNKKEVIDGIKAVCDIE